MERTLTAHSTASQSTTPSLPPCASQQDYYNMTNFYIPTLKSKKYNLLKLRQLLTHKTQQKQNAHLRKKLSLPYPSSGEKLLSKQISHSSFKSSENTLHPAYLMVQARNRRTLEFYNCKKKIPPVNGGDCCLPFLTESEVVRQYDRDG